MPTQTDVATILKTPKIGHDEHNQIKEPQAGGDRLLGHAAGNQGEYLLEKTDCASSKGPDFTANNSPVIIIGMHRSGTSMITGILESLGLFVGINKDENCEALFFQKINDWILKQSGGRWDIPGKIYDNGRGIVEEMTSDPEIRQAVKAHIASMLRGPRSVQFLGLKKYLQEGMCNLQSPWGWKDPRNSLTLSIWLDFFQQAKIIYIQRHGLDVAQSLKNREQKTSQQLIAQTMTNRLKRHVAPSRVNFTSSPKCNQISEGMRLWQEYNHHCDNAVAYLPPERLLRIRYEDVIQNPQQILSQCSRFAGLNISEKRIEQVAKSIRPDRVFQYRRDPAIMEAAWRYSAALQSSGYKV